MMNKIRRLILSATILAASFGALGVLHACAGKTVEKEYTAYYGEIFTLPGISGQPSALWPGQRHGGDPHAHLRR